MKQNIIPSRAHAFSRTAVLARIFSTGIIAIGASLLSVLAAAERPVDSSTSWMTDNTRVALDMAARQIHPAGGSDQNIFFVGLDYHRVVTANNRDWATIVFQPTFAKLNHIAKPPPYFSDGNGKDLQWRYAYINYTGLSKGAFNIKAGHIEVPFGAESNERLNGGALRQLVSDIQKKLDWGGSINGVVDSFEYEVAVTRGSTNDWDTKNPTEIFSGRLGYYGQQKYDFGVSFIYGDYRVGKAVDETLNHRVGLDYRYYYRNYTWLAEISIGENGESQTQYGMTELSWKTPSEDLFLYGRVRHQRKTLVFPSAESTMFAGLRWTPLRNADVELQYTKDLDSAKAQEKVEAQLRFRL